MNHRYTFTFLLYSLNHDNAARATAFMHAVRNHAGRAWVMLDRPLAGMPPIILGVTP